MRLNKKVKTDKLEFDYSVNITKQGIFTAYLPEDIINKLESSGIKLNYGRGYKKGYFEGSSLKEVEEAISNIIEKYNEKKLISSSIVLRYQIITSCSYCKTKKGEIVPNGRWERKLNKNDKYHWLEGTEENNANHPNPFGFRVYVDPRKLNVYVYPDKTEYKEYVSIDEKDIPEGSTLDWLNSVCGMSWKDENDVKDIEYSEEVGIFFKNIILYICNLNEKLKKIFGEEMEISISKVPLLTNFSKGD